ncbi:aromatase/cyclase [Rhodococcoides yunnanense]|uniref:Aromatase/cyclase n=1 Tax=Rhodococcoides yunnanense TaxID=278209 RepID=A0ABU4BIM5_9NOCA|nr:aromatase/cyclase [Rhodococcus yunnanensis]MDV6263933.1 aromatase/cyclase [Rhodococcus yunnanensis]
MTTRQVEHEISIDAPASTVYRLLAEVENWPRIFPPTIYVDRIGLDVDDHQVRSGIGEERIRIWATANGEPKHWTSRRKLDPRKLQIAFQQEVSSPPVQAMGGTWIIEPQSGSMSKVRLLHGYRAINDDPEGLNWIDEAVDRNSKVELAALKQNIESVHASNELTFSFEDTLQINGTAKDAFDFVNDADKWDRRLPHVSSARLAEEMPGLQTLEMDTLAQDGSTHTTKSYRVTFPHRRIAYKQVTLPALMALHTGFWTFSEAEGGVAASSQHTVVLNTENIVRLLGVDATIADARSYVHKALSANSMATLRHAKDYAEGKRA